MFSWHPSVRGVAVGAAVGAIGRGIVVALHLGDLTAMTLPIVLMAAAIGAIIGAAAGLIGRIWLGAVVGAGLSVIVVAVTLPVSFLVATMGDLSVPPIVTITLIGALAGVAGGAAARGLEAARPVNGEAIVITSREETR
jgi:hypothetical protein